MSNKTIEFRYRAYSDEDKLEPSEISYELPMTDDADFAELLKHFRRFLKAVGVQ